MEHLRHGRPTKESCHLLYTIGVDGAGAGNILLFGNEPPSAHKTFEVDGNVSSKAITLRGNISAEAETA